MKNNEWHGLPLGKVEVIDNLASFCKTMNALRSCDDGTAKQIFEHLLDLTSSYSHAAADFNLKELGGQ